MTQYFSKKWILFASRPTPLLRRRFRNDWYLWMNTISQLELSRILIIGEKGYSSVFVLKRENDKNHRRIKQDYQQDLVEKYFKRFQELIKKGVTGKNILEETINSYRQVGSILLYNHYLERVLTEESGKKLGKKAGDRLKKFIRLNSQQRNHLIQVQDSYYFKALNYLKRKYKRKDIEYCLPEELMSGKKIEAKKIKDRKSLFVYISTKNKRTVYSDKSARTMLKREGFTKRSPSAIKEFEGLSVYHGKITGKVLIVKKLMDFEKFKSNEIIVSPMTIVQMNPYLKKAKAIVTNEGGVTCHAAICSREFKIPCVVGTKIATQVLKTGSQVEVNANKGIIKVLKR